MTKEKPKINGVPKDVWSLVQEQLAEKGIDLENLCCQGVPGSSVKVVCIAPNLGESVQEMGKTPRNLTVMIRTDEETSQTLDDWVETGYFKSRSEAAALFLREGLKTRTSELDKIKEALQQVKKAKERLRDKAGEIFGEKKRPE
jgi:Arc/MetJ-type ribon-helix-helix transcriptional regulator